MSGVVGDRRMLPGSIVKRLWDMVCSLVALKCIVVMEWQWKPQGFTVELWNRKYVDHNCQTIRTVHKRSISLGLFLQLHITTPDFHTHHHKLSNDKANPLPGPLRNPPSYCQ